MVRNWRVGFDLMVKLETEPELEFSFPECVAWFSKLNHVPFSGQHTALCPERRWTLLWSIILEKNILKVKESGKVLSHAKLFKREA